MSDFYLLETYGAYWCLAIHPELEVVAYDTGCMIIVWNIRSESKISLLKHDYEVVCIKFIEVIDSQRELLISIDKSGVGVLWDLDTGTCVHEFKFSSRQRLEKVFLQQFPGTLTFCGGESDYEGSSYWVSIWELDKNVFSLKAKAEEFTDMDLKAICYLPGC